MKTFAAATIIALASVASAQLDNLPSCALTCFLEPLQNDGCSSLSDFACHCEQADTLIASVQPCVQGACSAEDQATVISGVEEICAGAGVPVTLPDPNASSAPGSATPTPEPSSEAPSATPTPTPEPTEDVSSAVSSAVASASSAVESIASSIASVLPTITGGNATGSATPSPTISEFTGAAAQATKAVGVIGAAALAMLAL
ncbi:GPI anchored CFEM domain-containing protein [Corynespora cassiicola Philippines]|uniref:GPI anchored CFEM domain-containing protein n=1 Tax=Corynespora cassiicola Philippines TaxID=1448308 RepID=A0A2T2P6P5_CORCC|nr:GPI anchored CFEM domain-containing protein [Corynespora cassiicola Philippines]